MNRLGLLTAATITLLTISACGQQQSTGYKSSNDLADALISGGVSCAGGAPVFAPNPTDDGEAALCGDMRIHYYPNAIPVDRAIACTSTDMPSPRAAGLNWYTNYGTAEQVEQVAKALNGYVTAVGVWNSEACDRLSQ